MKEKVANFITAFKILSQLPAGAIRTRVFDVLFSLDRQFLTNNMSADEFSYDVVCFEGITTRHLTISLPVENRNICMTAITGGENETFTIIGDEGL